MSEINWQNIRPWNGSRNEGFEELCVQLARGKVPDGTRLRRTGVQDAGVECYYVFDHDQSEWGWQSKFFTSALTDSQWGQLDRSVKTALDNHPNLSRYFVCVPHNRSARGTEGQTSEMEKWDKRVEKWKGWAKGRCMDVEFVWWGASELKERLLKDENIESLWYWFDQRHFDQKWFQQRLDEAVDDADPRYTREAHVELPVARDLGRFGRSAFAIDEVKKTAVGVRKARAEMLTAKGSYKRVAPNIDIDGLSEQTGKIIDGLAQVQVSPAGALPFDGIAQAADEAAVSCKEISLEVRNIQRLFEAQSSENRDDHRRVQEQLRSCRYYLLNLSSELEHVASACRYADKFAGNDVLLVKGDAGSGKTHLLCDVAETRLAEGAPTVLVLGHWFRGAEDPWTQLLRRLHLGDRSPEQFVGALEAAAQSSNRRALVMIDALNEGNGRNIWHGELASFLKSLTNSPWVAVVLSVRSSYENVLIPEAVRSKAVHLEHQGFEGVEYDAIASYFARYGIELPSSPLLQPEFNNPLFLKTICKGLHERGETRIPLGFRGITRVFSLYLDTVNRRLATELDYDPKDDLVKRALDEFATFLIQNETRWCSRNHAKEIVDRLLLTQGFSASLYEKLVSEGVLLEDMHWATDDPEEEVVFISYERYADHVVADRLLQTHLGESDEVRQDTSKLSSILSRIGASSRSRRIPKAFRRMIPCARGLPFLWRRTGFMTPGLLEALCIQVPEKTGRELIRIEPIAADHPGIGNAYVQSLVWRSLDSFSDDSHEVLKALLREGKVRDNPLRALLTVSTVRDHYFNADYLHERLDAGSLAERDSWWSVFLHTDWERRGATFRLVDWATRVTPNDRIDSSVVDLAVTTLAWMLASSNRFLRDKATKALGTLLADRHESTQLMLKRFYGVDDPYVAERVYAVAYGVAMRSHDAAKVGELATLVYEQVFADEYPPPHILLRDYARGAIERATYLGASLSIEEDLIRPPYRGELPSIPSEARIDELYPKPDYLGTNRRNPEWARNRILQSVTADDFWFYVIGRDSRSHWLALGLDDEPWLSVEERKQELIRGMTEQEKSLWDAYQEARLAEPPVIELSFVAPNNETDERTTESPVSIEDDVVESARKRVEEAYTQLVSSLTPDHRAELESILGDEEDPIKRHGPRFNKQLIQGYVLGRVVDLGWTVERFGRFDDGTIGYSGRDASKPERIGKKYQWIAYHEILAHLSDHLQYRDPYRAGQDGRAYQGPWQELLRDIDPSCILPSTAGGTGWETNEGPWWAGETKEDWIKEIGHREWLAKAEDLPAVDQLLAVENPNDDSRWLNLSGNVFWREHHPIDEDFYEKNRRQIWIGITAYFVRNRDAASFMGWAESVNFWGRWMPEPTEWHHVFLGEYGWSPAYRYFHDELFGGEDWQGTNEPNAECPVKFQVASSSYLAERGGFDCSIDESYHLGLPHPNLIRHCELRWHGKDADFVDGKGKLAAFDPTTKSPGPDAVLIREDLIKEYLQDNDLTLCWVAFGEKNVIGGDASDVYHGRLKISGAYRLADDGPTGSLSCVAE